MKRPAVIDLHIHTTFSDGTNDPSEIAALAKAAGIEIFSVTDHDTVKAAAVVKESLKEGDPGFITGVEFSCSDEDGYYHILGYGYDPEAAPINGAMETAHSIRVLKVSRRLDFLKRRFGFEFSDEDIAKLHALKNPGKPHIGNLMVQYGYAPSRESAINDFISKFHSGDEHIRPENAIEAILKSGGIPVLAHPYYGKGDELIYGERLRFRVKRLMDFGLEGLEGFYSEYSPKISREVVNLAEKNGLYVTAGSDYHGKNKMITLGDTGPGHEKPVPGLERFLADISSRIIRVK